MAERHCRDTRECEPGEVSLEAGEGARQSRPQGGGLFHKPRHRISCFLFLLQSSHDAWTPPVPRDAPRMGQTSSGHAQREGSSSYLYAMDTAV